LDAIKLAKKLDGLSLEDSDWGAHKSESAGEEVLGQLFKVSEKMRGLI
jgi:hypothetical protein